MELTLKAGWVDHSDFTYPQYINGERRTIKAGHVDLDIGQFYSVVSTTDFSWSVFMEKRVDDYDDNGVPIAEGKADSVESAKILAEQAIREAIR